MELKKEFRKFDGFIFDCDGVVWRGETKIEEVDKVVEILRKRNKKIIFLTNNSTKTRKDYVKKLEAFGIKTNVNEIITSGYATGHYLKRKYGTDLKILIIGEDGLEDEMRNFGYTIIYEDASWNFKVDAVVVGLDRQLTYDKLAAGAYAILNGAKFIATNTDPNIPTEKGLLPGAGAIVSFLETATGIKPEIIVGKPNAEIMNFALRVLNVKPEKVLVIGDRIETDILAAKRVECKSLLVLTGATTLNDVEKSKIKPNFVLKSLADMIL